MRNVILAATVIMYLGVMAIMLSPIAAQAAYLWRD